MNSAVYTGRIGVDAELKYTPSGAAVCSVNLAVNKGKDKQPLWIKATFWAKLAESVAKYLTKGKMISVQGETDVEAWIDKSSGEARGRITVNVRSFSFAGGGEKQESESAEDTRPKAQATEADDDIPF